MLNPKKQSKAVEVKEVDTLRSIFVIPNPFDDYLREKKGWFSDIQKLETQVKHMKERVSELNSTQANLHLHLQSIRAYCAELPNRRKR